MSTRNDMFHLTRQDGLAAERLMDWCVCQLRDADFDYLVALIDQQGDGTGWLEWHDLVAAVAWSNNLPNLTRSQICMLTNVAGGLSRLDGMASCYSGFSRDLSSLHQILARRVAA